MDLITPAVIWTTGLGALILVVYYVFMARTVLQMVRVGSARLLIDRVGISAPHLGD